MARKPADQSVSREDIIRAAADVLHRQGYETVTMKDIAAEVNLTAASLYHHFTNKNALVLAVLEEGISHIINMLEPVAQSKLNVADKLRKLIQVHVCTITEHPAVSAVMIFEMRPFMQLKNAELGLMAGDDDPKLIEMRDRFLARRDQFERTFRNVIEEGIASGEFCDVDAAIITRAILGANNWTSVWYREGGRLSGQQIADMLADHALRSLQA